MHIRQITSCVPAYWEQPVSHHRWDWRRVSSWSACLVALIAFMPPFALAEFRDIHPDLPYCPGEGPPGPQPTQTPPAPTPTPVPTPPAPTPDPNQCACPFSPKECKPATMKHCKVPEPSGIMMRICDWYNRACPVITTSWGGDGDDCGDVPINQPCPEKIVDVADIDHCTPPTCKSVSSDGGHTVAPCKASPDKSRKVRIRCVESSRNPNNGEDGWDVDSSCTSDVQTCSTTTCAKRVRRAANNCALDNEHEAPVACEPRECRPAEPAGPLS